MRERIPRDARAGARTVGPRVVITGRRTVTDCAETIKERDSLGKTIPEISSARGRGRMQEGAERDTLSVGGSYPIMLVWVESGALIHPPSVSPRSRGRFGKNVERNGRPLRHVDRHSYSTKFYAR